MRVTNQISMLAVFAAAAVRSHPFATTTVSSVTDSTTSFPTALPTFVLGDGNLGKELGRMLGKVSCIISRLLPLLTYHLHLI